MIEDNEERNDPAQQTVRLSRKQSATQRRRRQRLNKKRHAAAEDPALPVAAASAVIVAAEVSDSRRAVKKIKRARAAAAAKPTTISMAAASISTSASSLSTSSNNGDTSFQELDCYLQNTMPLDFTAILPTPSEADEQSCTAQSCDQRELASAAKHLPVREPVEHWQLRDQLEMQWSSEVSSVQTTVLETNHWTAQQQQKHVTQAQQWQQWAALADELQYVQQSNPNLSYPCDQESNYCERSYYIQTNTYTQRVYSSNNNSSTCSAAEQRRQQEQQQVFQRKRRFEEYNSGQV